MKRIAVTPRADWQDQMARIGFDYHSIDGNYWQENACYVFDEAQIDTLDDATNELHQMYLSAASDIIKAGDYARLGLDDRSAMLIERSFSRKQPSLYGRFDLCYDGTNPPKLYEYNADTPTSLFEASVAQWYWLQDQGGQLADADQFNSIHERLLVEFGALKQQHFGELLMHFAAVSHSVEDYTTTRYLQDVATQAGISTEYIDIGAIGYRAADFSFTDTDDRVIRQLFKLYPWEWLLAEEFGALIADSDTTFIEPAYKLLLSNKAMLAVLWEKFPNHPNLLPASLNASDLSGDVVAKPFFSREGANISLTLGDLSIRSGGDYDVGQFVYQAAQPLPEFTNNQGSKVYPVIGSWIIGNQAAGIGVREDSTLITKDTSLFVPHVFF